MYLPGSDTVTKAFRLTASDKTAIRRGYKTVKSLVIGVGTGIAVDPSFSSIVESPQKGAIVAAVATAFSATYGKLRRSQKFVEEGVAEPNSTEGQVNAALYTPVPEDSQ